MENMGKKGNGNLFTRFCDRHKKFIYVTVFALAALFLVVLPLFSVTIPAGHGGVYYLRFMRGTDLTHTYKEGFRFVLPWNRMCVYNLRTQEETVKFQALTLGGLAVGVDISVLFHPVPEELPRLHVRFGELYREKLIIPTTMAAARAVLTRYNPGDLYGTVPLNLQNEITILLKDALASRHVYLDAVLVKRIELPGFVEEAVNQKYMAEQDLLRFRYTLQKSIEELKAGYIKAETARVQQAVLSESLTEAYLRFTGIKATLALAASENAKVVVVGGAENGLPLIMNLGEGYKAPATASPAPAGDMQPAAPGGAAGSEKRRALDDVIGPSLQDGRDGLSEIMNFTRLQPLLKHLEPLAPDLGSIGSGSPEGISGRNETTKPQ